MTELLGFTWPETPIGAPGTACAAADVATATTRPAAKTALIDLRRFEMLTASPIGARVETETVPRPPGNLRRGPVLYIERKLGAVGAKPGLRRVFQAAALVACGTVAPRLAYLRDSKGIWVGLLVEHPALELRRAPLARLIDSE